jgi:hypothetical protein
VPEDDVAHLHDTVPETQERPDDVSYNYDQDQPEEEDTYPQSGDDLDDVN